eukprot:1040127-Amphidinium_carterae.4
MTKHCGVSRLRRTWQHQQKAQDVAHTPRFDASNPQRHGPHGHTWGKLDCGARVGTEFPIPLKLRARDSGEGS